MAKSNGFFNTIKNLFSKKKDNEQENSTGNTTSAAPASEPVTTQQQPAQTKPQVQYNTVVKKADSGTSGIYQYKSDTGFKDKNEINKQYQYARSLGYDKQQSLELMKSGTRWMDVALGDNGRPIVSYKEQAGKGFSSREEIDAQYNLARRTGMKKEDILKAMKSGTRWMEEPEEQPQAAEPEVPKQLWEDEGYMNQAEDRSWFRKAANFAPNLIAQSFADEAAHPEELYISHLKQRGYSDKKIEEMRESGELAKMMEGYLNRYNTKQDNTFAGQAIANFRLGNLQEQSRAMIGQGVINGDQELIEQGMKLRDQANAYATLNEEALTSDLHYDLPKGLDWAEGAVDTGLGWISKDMAQYAPQRLYQQAAAAPAQLLLSGLPTDSKIMSKVGFGLGQAFGAGTWTYTGTLGSSYSDLIDKGVEPVAAANLAKDEAAISSAFESTDEFFDWAFGVASDINPFKGVSKKAAKSLISKIGSALGKWGWNTWQEGAQEVWQEMVSMANERRLADGNTNGGIGELMAYWLSVVRDKYPEMWSALKKEGVTEDTERLWEARRGGMIIGGIGGGGSMVAGGIRNNIQRAQANRSFDNLIVSATQNPESLQEMSDADLVEIRKTAEDLGREDVTEILNEELDRRGLQKTEPATASTSNAAANTVAEEPKGRLTELREAAYADIAELSDEELQEYITLLQESRDIHENAQEEAMREAAADIQDDLEDAMAEGRRRQDIREAAANPEENTAAPVEEQPAEQYNEDINATEGATENGRIEGNAEGVDSTNRPATYSRMAVGSSETGRGSELQEEYTAAGRVSEEVEGTRNSRVQAEEQTNPAVERTGERGNVGDQTVQRNVSERNTGRVSRIIEAIEQHFNLDKFRKNPVRYHQNIVKMAAHNVDTLNRVFGSHEKASKFVRSWMQDEVNALSLQLFNSHLINNKKLTRNQQLAAYQAMASNLIIKDFLEGNISAQDIVDIAGIDISEAEQIVASAEKNITAKLSESRILNKDGSLRTKSPLREKAKQANRGSGKNNPTANIAAGEKVGTAKSLNMSERYVAQPGDQQIRIDNKYGNKVYRRGETYLVVNKAGIVFAETNEGQDTEDALRAAKAIANANSPSYEVASVRLFENGMYFDTNTGILMDQENIFRKENMISVQGSLASDLMEVAYTDMQKGERKGTTDWFKVNLSPKKTDPIGSLTNATDTIRKFINASYPSDPKAPRGIKMENGKRYVFFGMTANGAKKGEAIMVEASLYDKLRTASLSGKKESEVKKFNPAKYLTTSATIFSPSNNDLGIKIAPKGKDGKRHPQVAVIGDLYTIRPDTLRQFMRVDNEVDEEKLTKTFTDTMVRKLMANGMSKSEAQAEAAKVVPGQVKEIIANNDVGAIVNIMADLMFQVTDGTGFVNIPEGSPYAGQSTQMRSLGGFKAQLIGFNFAEYLNDVIPFNENAEYLYYGEEGEIAGGFRYQSKEKGVEVLSYWGAASNDTSDNHWLAVKDLKAILFNSTVKFAGEFKTAEEFYNATGDADLRSIPRENVYGSNVSDGAYEGYKLRGLSQLLRSQFNFTDEEVKTVIDNRLSEVIKNIREDPQVAAKLFGVDFNGKAPPKSDSKAYAIWQHGPSFFNTRDGKRWVADKIGNLIENMRSGDFPFMEGEAAFGWIDPDVIGLVKAMTAITRISNTEGSILRQTEGGGFGLDGYAGLTPGQIFNARLDNANNDNRTVVGRFPSTKAIDVQVRENVNTSDPRYQKMVEKYGLDKANIYIAINDTLSMYLDNDYDGDPIITFQGALADLYDKIRSRDTLDSTGKPMKRNVLHATTNGIETTDTEALGAKDYGPVEFSHAKANKVDIEAKTILEAVRRYLAVNDNTSRTHEGPMPVGVYDNMVERLAAIPDSALKKVAEREGMDVKEYRALMEARFGVAYVLSIDYAKTGRDFREFFTLVESLDKMLYDIAEEEGIISLRETDKQTGEKITEKDAFVPSWWEFANSTSKKKNFETAKSKKKKIANNPNTLLSAIQRVLPTKTNREGGTTGRTTWTDALNQYKEKLGYGVRQRLNWSGGMTASPNAYQYSREFYQKLSDIYFDIISGDNDEFKQLRDMYDKRGRKDVKDMDIRNYLLYKHFQQNLGLTNEQVNDLFMMMLSNSNASSGTIISFDQSQFTKNNGEMSSKDIYQRNVALTKTFEKAMESLYNVSNNISSFGDKLIKTRQNLATLLDSRKSALNAADAARVSRIADMQNYLEEANRNLQQNMDELLSGISTNAKEIDAEDLDVYREAFQSMLNRIAAVKEQLNSNDSVFASGIAKDISEVISDVDKDLRDSLRHINTLESSINELYDAYTKRLNEAATASDSLQHVVGNNVTGLEGMTEDEILEKVRSADNEDGGSRLSESESGRRGSTDTSAEGQELLGRGAGGEDQKVPGRRTESERGRTVTVDSENESQIQSGTRKLSGRLELATDASNNNLAVEFQKDGTVEFVESSGKTETDRWRIINGGRIITNKEMNALQRATQSVLRKFGIHVVYTTQNLVNTRTGSGREGLTFGIRSKNTGEIFIAVNIHSKEGGITARHEAAHALIEQFGNEKIATEWMQQTVKGLVDNGTLKKTDFNRIYKAFTALADDDSYAGIHEFFAHLLSGDNFYGAFPQLSDTFMRNGMAEYQKTGTFPVLSDLISQIAPNASAEDVSELMSFFTDPYQAKPRIFARNATTTETEAVAEEPTTTTTNTTPEESQPLPFAQRRKNIAKSVTKIQSAVEGSLPGLAQKNTKAAAKSAEKLKGFNKTLKMFFKGKATSNELYVAYNQLKGTLFRDDTVDPYFDDIINKEKFPTEDAYNEAVEHALAKFAAHADNVIQSETNSASLETETKPIKMEGINKVRNWLGSWQVNAPTFFRMLSGFVKATTGYQIGGDIETANKNMQRHYWEADKRMQPVRRMKDYDKLMNGDIKVTIPHIGEKGAKLSAEITSLEAINLLRMLNTVEYTQGDLSSVKGINLSDGTHLNMVQYSRGMGYNLNDTINEVRDRLTEYFKSEASAVEKAYYNAATEIFNYFTPEVKRVGMKLNGFVDMMPEDKYSPVYWGSNHSFDSDFNPREAQLKSDPRYMKSRSEEASGSLNINPMDAVLDTYVKKMSDYLAFGELREQLRLMNTAAEGRTTKTLGQLAGQNMGADYARFINNYVRDLTNYADNSNSFWYKARTLMQRGTLMGNMSVMMKQSASYFNAASVIDMRYLMAAISSKEFGKHYAEGKSGLLEYRRITENIDPTLTETFSKKLNLPFLKLFSGVENLFKHGISMVDYATVRRLYTASCLQIHAENPTLDINSQEFTDKVENLFSDAVIQTQPQFDISLRPENSRTSNEGVRMVSMFRTQQAQNFNKILTAMGEYKADPNKETRAVKAAALTGLVCSGLALALFSCMADAVLHRRRKYKDKDGEITAETIGARILINSAEAMAGTVWFGDDVAKLIIDQLNIVDTQEFYGLSMGPVSTMYDAAESLKDFTGAIRDHKNVVAAGKKFVGYLTQSLGMPINNANNYANAIVMTMLDHMGENPEEYDDWTKWLDNQLRAQNQLVKAAEAGNEKKTNKLWKSLGERYAEPKKELNEQLQKDYKRGKVSEETAANLLITYGGLDDEEAAKKRLAKWEFAAEHPEYKDYSDSQVDRWHSYVEPAGISLEMYDKVLKEKSRLDKDKGNGSDANDVLLYLNSLNLSDSDMDALWQGADYSLNNGSYSGWRNTVRQTGVDLQTYLDAREYYEALGKDKDNGNDNAAMLSYLEKLNLTKAQKDAIWGTLGRSVYVANKTTSTIYDGYYKYAKDVGLTPEAWSTHYEKFNSLSSTKDSKGRVTKSKQEKVIAYINGLNLSKKQKDALWLSFGYKTTTKAYKTRPWK